MAEKAAPLLLCAATRWEAQPLVSRWGLREAGLSRFEGSVAGVPVVLVKTGIGAGNARESLASLSVSPRLAISTGFAGALQPKMAPGDLVLDVRGLDLEIAQAAREISATKKVAIHFGKISHADAVVAIPARKRKMGSDLRCCAVDMESAAIRTWAEGRGAAFLTARVILDAVDERLPAETPAGEGLKDLVPFAFKNASALPLLLRLGLRQKRAMVRLGDFLEDFLPRL